MIQSKVTKEPIILLFEDIEKNRTERCARIQAVISKGIHVASYEDVSLDRNPNVAIEYRLAQDLKKRPLYNNGDIGLIVCDRALDGYNNFQVASESVVSAAARTLGVPICLYERGANAHGISLKQRKPWEKGEIIIDGDGPAFGEECAALYNGFQSIRNRFSKLSSAQFLKMTPAEILSAILSKPEETNRIALYGTGEQGLLEDLMPFYDPDKKTDIRKLKQHYPRVIGNWLFSSILRFPGILVNSYAAGSFLNINPSDLLNNPSVRKLFSSAEYKGPFADSACNWNWWWRRDLENLINKAGVCSGFELVQKKKISSIGGCKCCEGKDHPAGFVCMISGEPVCEKHSRGGISWFPAGADLARVRTSVYNKIGPFLGLY